MCDQTGKVDIFNDICVYLSMTMLVESDKQYYFPRQGNVSEFKVIAVLDDSIKSKQNDTNGTFEVGLDEERI